MKKLLGIFTFVLALTLSIATPSDLALGKASVRPGSSSSSFSSSSSKTYKPSVRPGGSSSSSSLFGSSSSLSRKPTDSSYNRSAVSAKQQDESRKVFYKSNPPKSSFTTASGRTYKIDPNNSGTRAIRRMSADDYNPQFRRQRVDTYYRTYYPRYSYYASRPRVYIGPYRSEFWYSTYDWDAERQARWLYNNQQYVDSVIWQQRMSNIAVAAYINSWRASGLRADPNYIDPQFSNATYAMYSDEYIDAVYNGSPVDTAASLAIGAFLMWSTGIIIFLVLVYFLVFKAQWSAD